MRTGRPCASCSHSRKDEIDRKLKAGASYRDVSRWLKDTGEKVIQPAAIGQHAKAHLGVEAPRGRRPTSGDFLKDVVDAAAEGLAEGKLNVTLRDGIQAQKVLYDRETRDLDRDILAKITISLTGGALRRGLPEPRDAEVEAIEGEFRELLTSG